MNERIRQLWEDNDTIEVCYPEQGSPVSVSATTLEKFAELIVKECVDIVSGTAVNTPPNDLFYGYNLGVNKAAENIKERFGIEE